MTPTSSSGAGRPAEASRPLATVPSGLKWSFGAIVEIIIGASVCPNNCAMTGPIWINAASSFAAEIGAAPYQKHCSELLSVRARSGCSSSI